MQEERILWRASKCPKKIWDLDMLEFAILYNARGYDRYCPLFYHDENTPKTFVCNFHQKTLLSLLNTQVHNYTCWSTFL
jgi:hypothetical protein